MTPSTGWSTCSTSASCSPSASCSQPSSSLHLTTAITKNGLARPPKDQVTITKDQTVAPVPTETPRVIGRGTQVGTVYRLSDGRLVYVVGTGTATPSVSPSPTSTGTGP